MARKEFPLSFVESQIRIEKQAKEDYYKKNPDSLILSFERELADMGFTFETSSQTLALMPRCKEWLLPIIVSYYNRAKQEKRYNEQNHFLGFFCHKGLDEVIPMLIKDFWSSDTPDLTKWFISDCIYSIQSKSFVNDYMEIILCKRFGINRQMIVLLLGKIKEESAIPALIQLLDDDLVRIQAITALGYYKREEFRIIFERFSSSKSIGERNAAKAALKKLS